MYKCIICVHYYGQDEKNPLCSCTYIHLHITVVGCSIENLVTTHSTTQDVPHCIVFDVTVMKFFARNRISKKKEAQQT